MAEAHLIGHYDHLVATSPWPAVGAIGAFALATGFHGAHVIIGTIFLTVYLIHAAQGHFKPDHHFGLEAAAWYWHFVDVVWLFLLACIYWRGRAGATIHCGGPVAGVCHRHGALQLPLNVGGRFSR